MEAKKWLDGFKAKTIIFEVYEPDGSFESLQAMPVQAVRVNRLRRRLFFKQAMKRGLSAKRASRIALLTGKHEISI